MVEEAVDEIDDEDPESGEGDESETLSPCNLDDDKAEVDSGVVVGLVGKMSTGEVGLPIPLDGDSGLPDGELVDKFTLNLKPKRCVLSDFRSTRHVLSKLSFTGASQSSHL